jgi:hypothetical protein
MEEFENTYSSEHALQWYTRPSPVYQILNKAARMRDPHILLPYRFLIKDLFKELKRLQRQQPATPLRVYRDQLMSSEELGILISLTGHIMNWSSFLSTTLNRTVALFLLDTLTHSRVDGLQAVLFEIDPQPSYDDRVSFANISEKSTFPEEEEVLIMLNALFCIQSCTYENYTGIWIMHLTMCNSDDPYLMQLPQYQMIESAIAGMNSRDPSNDPSFMISDSMIKFLYGRTKDNNALLSPHIACCLS